VALVILGISTSDPTDANGVCTAEDGLSNGTNDTAGVVLHLSSEDGTGLSIKLLTPVDVTRDDLRIEFVENLDGDKSRLGLVTSVSSNGSTRENLDIITEIELAVTESNGGRNFARRAVLSSRGRLGLRDRSLTNSEDLLDELASDEGSLVSEGFDRVEVITISGEILGDGLLHEELVCDGVRAAVNEDALGGLGDEEVPRLDSVLSSHKEGENLLGGEDVGGLLCGVVGNDGVGGCVGSVLVNRGSVEGDRGADGGAVEGIVVLLEGTDVLQGLSVGGEDADALELLEGDLFDGLPGRVHEDRRFTLELLTVHVTVAADVTTLVLVLSVGGAGAGVSAGVGAGAGGSLLLGSSTALSSLRTELGGNVTSKASLESRLRRLTLDEVERASIFFALEGETTDDTTNVATLGLIGPVRDMPSTIRGFVVRLEELILENRSNSLSRAETGRINIHATDRLL